ncbi:uncharacterized protein LOC114540873 isoform X2 [Dendronephthya gigantea]|uniref:uncharacterized protein LOC114533035 isoform X2 n=1 Tax=Dendronephthya gigantea TaxID=151771 RepID=UPI00106D9C32|nr:uncharacterized protein LOC114533035 isoform X2 [Dendronephthya gigantea]XP_028416685.1 uncharacterized protein LOC114540873 isoform X2 [Dendronephthya gigantea]
MATTPQPIRQDSNQGKETDCANVVLFHSNVPVVSVERGTTFGLIKMLYESIGGNGKIIGLKQRQNTSSLAFIITQEQTNLTEQEYDIILHGGNKSAETNLETKSTNKHDKEINTYISLRPDQMWYPAWADSYSASTRRSWQKTPDDIVNHVETTTKSGIYLSEKMDKERKNIEGFPDHFNVQTRQKFVPVESTFEYLASRKEVRIDCTTRDENNEEKRVAFLRDSTSPSTASIDSPGGSSQNSPHHQRLQQPRENAHRRETIPM